MSIHSQLNIDEFHQLILNASSYMTKIDSFSFKIVNSSVQSILKCLTIAEQILFDQNAPIIKKLFVLRFVKDTMILASLPFYECVLVKILPWIISAAKISETNSLQKRIEMMGKLLKGNQELVNSDANICKTILQLVEQLIKWMGTNIRDHPYSKLTFRSAFKILLQKLPRIQSMRVTDLTFFKNDDPNKYQAYFMERESGQAEGQRIAEYVSQIIQQAERGKTLPDLQVLAETGDQFVISALIEEIEGILEDVRPDNILNMLILVQQINRLVAIGDVQAVNLVKDFLLEKVLLILQILQKHKQQYKSGDLQITTVVSMIKAWNSKCQSLLLPVQTFRQAFRLLQREGIQTNVEEIKLDYEHRLGLTFEINKQKLNQIDCNQSGAIKRIRACRYIPVYESIPFSKKQKQKNEEVNQSQSQNQQFLSSNKSFSKNSKVSENSIYNKKQFLQAFSKFPQQLNLLKNNSQVNEIHLQHSNLSDQFHQINNLMQAAQKPLNGSSQSQKQPLIMSFKKPDNRIQNNSPEVVFSDSFTSNQKNSPYKLVNSKDFIDVVNQPSMSVRSQHSLKESGSQRFKQSQHSSNNPFQKGSNALIRQPEREILNYNDYMLPENNGSYQPQPSYKSSKESSKIKKEKSSSLARSNNRLLLKSGSREKLISPISKISNSKSINILQFNEAEYPMEQRYKPEVSSKNIPAVEQIKVEKTIMKPKFGFKAEEESITTQINTDIIPSGSRQSINQSDSISSIHSKLRQSKSLGTIPDNFMDLLKVKPEKVRVNGFDGKVKQLQRKIQKMKSKKEQVAQVVLDKEIEIRKLKTQMPLPKEQIQQQNKKLKRAMQPRKVQKAEIQYKLNHPLQNKGIMKHISVTALRQDIKKQILYSKCRLYKQQYLQIGFQAKNKQLSLYFTFLAPMEECNVKVQENSLILVQEIDAKIYKLSQGKQIKFKASVKDYKLFNGQFQMASLKVSLQTMRKKLSSIQVTIPYHLYNMIQFVPPKMVSKFNKITDWHYCCDGILTNPHYIADFFPTVKSNGALFSLRGQLQFNFSQIRIIIDNNKFAIQFQGINEAFELMTIRCVIALLQKSNS